MTLEEKLKRRKAEHEQQRAEEEAPQKKWDEMVRAQLTDVLGKLGGLIKKGLLERDFIDPFPPLRIRDPITHKSVLFRQSKPEEQVIFMEASGRSRALWWNGSSWRILMEAPPRSRASGGLADEFDFDNTKEYTEENLHEALEVLLGID